MTTTRLNEILVVDELLNKYPNIGLYGDLARGKFTESYTNSDYPLLVSDTSEVLIALPIIARSRVFETPAGGDYSASGEADNSRSEQLRILWSDVPPPTSTVEEEASESYLTKEEEDSVKAKHENAWYSLGLYQSPMCKPFLANLTMARAIYEYSVYDMRFSIHIVQPECVRTYLSSLADKDDLNFDANRVFFLAGDYSAKDDVMVNLNAKRIVFNATWKKKVTPNMAVRTEELKKEGWVLA